MKRLKSFLCLYRVIFDINKLLCLLNVFDLVFIAVVSNRIVLNVRSVVNREIEIPEILGI